MKPPDRPGTEAEPTVAAPIPSTSGDVYSSGSWELERPAVNNQGVIYCYTHLIEANYLRT